MTWRAITGFRLVTQDVDRAARFYAALDWQAGSAAPIDDAEMVMLGIPGGGTRLPLTLGRSRIDLDLFDRPGRHYPDVARANSPCFQHLALVTTDIVDAWRRAIAAGARPIGQPGPVQLPPSSGGAKAVKFRDPDGHPLELIQFADPAASGWDGEGLLGIDHSALVVTDLDASRRFYADHGLTAARGSFNVGPAQDALDGVADAHVDVAPMDPATTPPHVEMLHYRMPGPPCGPVAPNDVAATRIVWRAYRPALLADPDGHLHQLDA